MGVGQGSGRNVAPVNQASASVHAGAAGPDAADLSTGDLSTGDLSTGDLSTGDLSTVERQLGRRPRGVMAIAHRCQCGQPDVVKTAPRLPDGTPFPTLFYLTCPRASAELSRLEAAGRMREMTARLAADSALRQRYLAAHEDYLTRRDEAARHAGLPPLPPGTQSAGGMPDRVKCLHALAAHALAAPGVNPLGEEAVQAAGSWWAAGPCAANTCAANTCAPNTAAPSTRAPSTRASGNLRPGRRAG
jgi:uncharacterized protein